MISFIKKHWLLILLAFLAVLVSLAWFFARTAPPTEEPSLPQVPPPKEAVEPPSSRFSQPVLETAFTLAVPVPTIPGELEILETQKYNRENIIVNFANVFRDLKIDTNRAPRQTEFGPLIWETNDSALLIDVPSGKFVFSGRTKVTSGFNQTTAQNFAAQMVNNWGLATQVFPLRVSALTVTEGHLFEVQKTSEAEVFAVTLGALVGNFPIVGAGVGQEVIETRLTRDGEISTVNFDLHIPSKPLGLYKIKSWEEVVRDLNTGKAQTLWVKDLQGNPAASIEMEPIKSAIINRVYLAYFESGEAQDFYQPVFVFEGTGETVNGDKRTLAVFVPAVK